MTINTMKWVNYRFRRWEWQFNVINPFFKGLHFACIVDRYWSDVVKVRK